MPTAEVASGSKSKVSTAAPKKKHVRASTSGHKSDDSEEEADEVEQLKNNCCVCWTKLKSTERYKMCIECRGHAHVDCVWTTDDIFTCKNCYSDMEDDESDLDELQ